jgi:hypothetical protein
MKYLAEYTDTFAGEANYSWVRRETFEAPATASNRALIRRAKQAVGLRGPHKSTGNADMLCVLPRGMCAVLFVVPVDSDAEYF